MKPSHNARKFSPMKSTFDCSARSDGRIEVCRTVSRNVLMAEMAKAQPIQSAQNP